MKARHVRPCDLPCHLGFGLGFVWLCKANIISLKAIFVMAALWNRAGPYIFALWFLYSFFFLFFSRLISAVADWMSTILLLHMM